jgi:hypothetical protein
MNLPDLLKITTFVLDMLTDIHHSLQKSSRESNLDCNPVCELDRRITSSAYKRQSILLLLI